MKMPVTFLAFAAAAAAGTPAFAQPPAPAETFTAAVQQDDLNLASPAGLATFRGRVKALANRVCGEVPVAPLREADSVAACRAELFRSAESQIRPALASSGTGFAGGR